MTQDPTHRCEKSVKAGISIRHGYKSDWLKDVPGYETKGWQLRKIVHDSEFWKPILTNVCEIFYCPFCGEKLEVANREQQNSAMDESL